MSDGAGVAVAPVEDERRAPSPVPAWLDGAAGWAWRLLVIGVALALVAEVLGRLALVVVPLVMAVLLATLLVPVVEWLARRRVPRGLAAALVVVATVLFVGTATSVLVTSVVRELADLRGLMQDGAEPMLDRLGVALRLSPQVRDQATAGLQQLADGTAPDASAILAAVTGVGQVVTGSVLALVFTVILVADGRRVAAWVRDRLPGRHREEAAALGRRAWQSLSAYVRGLAVVAFLDAVGIGIGLVLIGVPLAAALTAIIFLSCFIPLVGPVVAGALAVVVAFVGAGPVPALVTLGLVLVIQQVAANVLQPLILGRSVALHPIVVVVALAVGSILAGVAGLFVAVPLTGVVAAVGNELRLRRGGTA